MHTSPMRWRVARRWSSVSAVRQLISRRSHLYAGRRLAPRAGHALRRLLRPSIAPDGGDRRHRHRRQDDHQQHHRLAAADGWAAHRPDEHRGFQDRRGALPNNSRFTTLEAPEVQGLLRRWSTAGVECAVVETTSSGLALHRVWGVAYDIAVVTNITTEHLEVHGTLEAYRRAKAMLFEAVDPDAPAKPVAFARRKAASSTPTIPRSTISKAFCRAPIMTYGVEAEADVRAEDLDLRPDGSSFRVRLPDGRPSRWRRRWWRATMSRTASRPSR